MGISNNQKLVLGLAGIGLVAAGVSGVFVLDNYLTRRMVSTVHWNQSFKYSI